ncbi:MAG: hypothetical protein ACTS8S_03590, partial [Giesbergeria sp.]
SCWHERDESGRRGIDLAKQQLQTGTDHAGLWTLVLAAAAYDDDRHADVVREFGYDTIEVAKQGFLSRARVLLPNHPAVDLLEARDLYSQEKFAEALPKYERLLDAPELANHDEAIAVWLTRIRVLGVSAALSQRFVEAGAGQWCYGLGVSLGDGDDIMEQLELSADERASFPSEALKSLSTRYYERAMLRFEAFFSTGEGNVRDADVHVYAMNCCNLAARYFAAEQYQQALELNTKGFDASPFAELLEGAMRCQYRLGCYPEYMEVAEKLWHFSLEHGYSSHQPGSYFGSLAWALQHMGRSAEIQIWLDRLRQSRQGLGTDDGNKLSDLLGSEAALLNYLHPHKPDDCLVRMGVIRDDLMRVGDTWALLRLGECFMTADEPQTALPVFERAVAVHDPKEDSEKLLSDSKNGVETAQAAIRKQQPFWRRWL